MDDTVRQRRELDLTFAQSGGRYVQETIDGLHDGFVEAGIDFAIFMPDATLDGIEQLLLTRKHIPTYQCVREDEGIAMAIGANMVGRRPVVLMEGSGLGMSATILARSIVQRTAMLVIAGHCGTMGERYDYHSTTRLVVESIFRALNLPYHVVMDGKDVKRTVVEGQRTVNGQKLPFGILLPPHVIRH
jgi:sulfopyruvate decarboxylase TPP-binding subunit